ncbi:hypothetical protein, partial [Telmatospirillum sp.]|uniref:hypothetical protein n=1 Tax=Telmatospirillum sp. TaxID=2079197 RepID=UPI0028432F9C
PEAPEGVTSLQTQTGLGSSWHLRTLLIQRFFEPATLKLPLTRVRSPAGSMAMIDLPAEK